MTRTHEKVRDTLKGKGNPLTPTTAAKGVESALAMLEGRWKLVILWRQSVALFGFRAGDSGDLAKNADPTATPDGE